MRDSEFRLDGKTAVVTGASSGIGAGIAAAMAVAGAQVVLVGRNRDRLAATAASVKEAGGKSLSIDVDVTSDDAPKLIVDETIKAFKSLDVLVHAAGIFWPEPFDQTTLERFDRQWVTNVRVPFALTQAALPHLKPRGNVIFLSSIAGHVGFPNSSAYCATKGAVELMVKALTMEFGREGVRFNCIAPGNIRTPMNAHLLADAEYEKTMLSFTPSGRIGTVDEVAPAAVYLASPAARYIFGTSLLVDGGWVAQ